MEKIDVDYKQRNWKIQAKLVKPEQGISGVEKGLDDSRPTTDQTLRGVVRT